MSCVFFDLETTGLDAREHTITQIAALAVDHDLRELEEFECKVWFDERRASREVLELTRYDADVWQREALAPKEAARVFAKFLRRYPAITLQGANGPYAVAKLVAHNAAFDGAFVQEWYRRRRVFLPAYRRVRCTLQRAEWFFDEHPELQAPDNFKLVSLCQHFGAGLSELEAHDALADVRGTVAMYRAMKGIAGRLREAA